MIHEPSTAEAAPTLTVLTAEHGTPAFIAPEQARQLEAVAVSGEWTPELARAWWDTHQPVSS